MDEEVTIEVRKHSGGKFQAKAFHTQGNINWAISEGEEMSSPAEALDSLQQQVIAVFAETLRVIQVEKSNA